MTRPILLDCTLRDGGYYNSWDFDPALVAEYLHAMEAAGVDVVELGQRFLSSSGFKGPHAFTTDDFLRRLDVPQRLKVAVMVNGADLLRTERVEDALEALFPEAAAQSPVDVVRIACHFREMERALSAAQWLKERGFTVGFNLMQIADRTREEVVEVARLAARHPVDVLYFADSMGSMNPDRTSEIISWLREGWDGALGIHTHDNMGLALQNTLRARSDGAQWLDATVTGMGRGPGNARTEELVIEMADTREAEPNLVPLLALVRGRFQPMKERYGWGTNPFYFLSGKYGIHPTYIQEMIGDSRYGEEDILAVLETLRTDGGKSYSEKSLSNARSFYSDTPEGSWSPASEMEGREILLLGSGPGAARHAAAIADYIARKQPLVMALNTQGALDEELIHYRIACHPVRLLADAARHAASPTPLITPAAMLPDSLKAALAAKHLRDFGIGVREGTLEWNETTCILPAPLVAIYALAVAASGRADRVLMAGFDGYPAGDRRNAEMDELLELYQAKGGAPELLAVTPTVAPLRETSIYGM